MKTTTVRFWPISEPIPKGWRVAGQRVSHHNVHSVLISKIDAADEMEWRPVPGFNGRYEVSEHGHVRRVFATKGGPAGGELKRWRDARGYWRVSLWRDDRGRQQHVPVHRVVALAFKGEPPSADHIVAHRDGDKDNNHHSNLRWATYQENSDDMVAHGTRLSGERAPNAALTNEQAEEVLRRRASGEKLKDLASAFGVSLSAIQHLCGGKSFARQRVTVGPRRGESAGRARVTEADVREIRRLHRSGVSQPKLAARYGLSPSTVHAITSGKSWRHVTDEGA